MPSLVATYPTAGPVETEGLQRVDEMLSGKRHERFAEAYEERRKTVDIAMQKLTRRGWYGAHYYYLGSGCLGMFYGLTLGGLLVVWLFEIKRGHDRLAGMVDQANGFIIKTLLPDYFQQEELVQTHGDDETAELVSKGIFFRGMTEKMLIDALGEPNSVSPAPPHSDGQKPQRERKAWYYEKEPANRYGVEIFLEDGEVVDWKRERPVRKNNYADREKGGR